MRCDILGKFDALSAFQPPHGHRGPARKCKPSRPVPLDLSSPVSPAGKKARIRRTTECFAANIARRPQNAHANSGVCDSNDVLPIVSACGPDESNIGGRSRGLSHQSITKNVLQSLRFGPQRNSSPSSPSPQTGENQRFQAHHTAPFNAQSY